MTGPVIKPEYLAKLDDAQRKWVITGPGNMFLNTFIWIKGNHCFVIGTTGSGKTNKGYWLVNWLKHTETQIWMDSGKSSEILPLLCQDMKVQIICPDYTDVIIEERINGKWQKIQDHPVVTQIPTAGDTWQAIKRSVDRNRHRVYDTINILCFRNAFWTTAARTEWMSELFETLSSRTRLGTMPAIFPCSIHIDESQWVLAGTRISRDVDRVKSTEIITENALEIRSSGGRLIMYAQAFTNIPPAIRENLVCAMLCRGAEVDSSESRKLSPFCNPPPNVTRPANFKKHQGKFITEDGRCCQLEPWSFPLMPKSEKDREWLDRCRVRYVGFNDQRPKEAEYKEECFPELGRFSAMAIPPEKQGDIISRWAAEGVTQTDD
jgi:hypothetical protein